MSDTRERELLAWATGEVVQQFPSACPAQRLQVVSGDASFRRYFRLLLTPSVALDDEVFRADTPSHPKALIAVDSPPVTEDNAAFVRLAALLIAAGVRAPSVLAVDYEQGFMLLEDFGDKMLLPALLDAGEAGALALYSPAFDALLALQEGVDSDALPDFDKPKLLAEMGLFTEWYCCGLLALELDARAREVLDRAFEFLADAALAQPQCAVHRDYHSRNLMLLDDGELGVIDFQDAVHGAYTYDLVSLLRDCYISWPPSLVEEWAGLFYQRRASSSAAVRQRGEQAFKRDFDLMGLQRHLKVMGIFSRLHLRDNKSAYLADIPLVTEYFLSVARQHPELSDILAWFEEVVVPRAAEQTRARNHKTDGANAKG